MKKHSEQPPKPAVAAGLSALLPGLGQLYIGDVSGGVALLCTTLGFAGGLAWATLGPDGSRSWLSALSLLAIYPVFCVPVVLDTLHRARGGVRAPPRYTGRWYVVVMLVTLGPLALPLLWQSATIPRIWKIVGSILVVAVAVAAVLLVLFVGSLLERQLGELRELLAASQSLPWLGRAVG